MANLQEDLLFLSLAEKISEESYDEVSILCDDKYCTIHNQKQIKTIILNQNNLNNSPKSSHRNLIENKCSKRINSPKTFNISSSRFDYKSGAIYDGKIKDNLKSGNGAFLWPNGDKYIGEFKDNYRHGYGISSKLFSLLI